MTERQERLQIENYALLTESATDLRGRLQEFYDYYQPTAPGECELMDLAVMSSVQWRRVLSHKNEVVNHKIRTAIFDFDYAQEDEVQRYRAMLATSPGAAILGLKRSALGVRHLTMGWERLERLLERDGTWYGGDRNEAINCQGARATPPESLSESEAGYLTWLYCLMAQPEPKDKDFVAIGQESWTPPALYDREPRDWLGEPPVCRQNLKNLVQRELASLRKREHMLISNYEEPARDGAEIRRQVLATPEGTLLLRHERAHELTYHRAYQAFLKGRRESVKTGRPPGAPHGVADDAGQGSAAVEPQPEPGSDATRVAEEKAQRKQAAAAVAPGADNGIGAPQGHADGMVEEVLKERLTPCEGNESDARAAVSREGTRF